MAERHGQRQRDGGTPVGRATDDHHVLLIREAPLILRLYGTADVVHEGDPRWDDLLALFPPLQGARNIFSLDVDLVQTSCGYGVPLMEFQSDRETMALWSAKKGDKGLVAYQQEKNRVSIDGFPTGLPVREDPPG
ncbi:hypothetical protein [Tessaracoccus coleopterorum]|uniref:hypothetical protein n=1 Tax=Tessaracoccus coleopterorum TaxID=2714950 RepID=UPI0018D30BE8|nr:hypothetical protein [Tessaracoccus coleopterorum]